MTKALQATLRNDYTCVRTWNGLTDSFSCTTGVKQGCPLSANLFGLFLIELDLTLEELMKNVPCADAPSLAGVSVC
jgi:hypothetical protein